jgi:ABC-2 type transport system ATP-binding protein
MLTATSLTRRFGERLAVDSVSFDVGEGEILALLGPNGAGKTTTLRLLAGLIAPSSGTVRIGNDVLTSRDGALRARIGLLTETPGLWDRLTVRQNLLTYARLYGVPAPAAAVQEVLSRLDIVDRADQITAQLSKGLRQRVALARALVHRPRLVLLDEPTSGLDPESARDVRALISGLRDEGRAVLLSTHNLDEVEKIADRIAVLRTRLVAVGTPEELRGRTCARTLRIRLRGSADAFAGQLRARGLDAHADGDSLSIALETPGAASVKNFNTPEVVRLLVQNGADIESVMSDEPSLEDTYLKLMEAGARE